MAKRGSTAAEAADTTAAGAIEGAGAALEAGGTPRDVAAATIGGAAAGQAEAIADDEAPTGDGETELDRKIERLSLIAEQAEFESGSLVGDIRDAIVEQYKNRPKPWSQLSEGEQRTLYSNLEHVAKLLLKKLVRVIAEEQDVSVPATLNGYSVDGNTFKLKVVANGDEETAAELFKMDGHEVVLIRADAKRFHGERKPGEVQPDQLGLTFADGEPREAPPADDSDLAGDDDDDDDTAS